MGTRLKEFRQAAGLSQEKLARAVDVTLRGYQLWEHGKRSFDFEMAVKLSRALGVSLDELAGQPEAETPAKKHKKQ
jgi:transcriptional regulator with XRE-family HTH domain